jgi:hypothetical protein
MWPLYLFGIVGLCTTLVLPDKDSVAIALMLSIGCIVLGIALT